MRIFSLLLTCYILVLLVLPAAEAMGLPEKKESCGRCCRKPSPTDKQEKEKPAKGPVTNPFQTCSSCTNINLSSSKFDLDLINLAKQTFMLSNEGRPITPYFKSWHPPELD